MGANVTAYIAPEKEEGDAIDEEIDHYLSLGKPIPGYTGHGRRIAADNIYGATFANAREKAKDSLATINHERDTNLDTMTQMIPPLGGPNPL